MTKPANGTPDSGRAYGVLAASIWLVLLLRPATEIAHSNSLSTPLKVLAWVILAAFATVYIIGFYRFGLGYSGWQQFAALGSLTVLTACLWPLIGTSTLSALPYLVAYAAFSFPPQTGRIVTPVTAVLALALTGLTAGFTELWYLVASIVIIAIGGMLKSYFIARLAAEHAQERLHLVLAERNRIARDVHDLLGHSLTVIGLKAQLVEKLLETDPQRAQNELSQIRQINADALANVRQTVSEIRAGDLTVELAQALKALTSGGVRVQLIGDVAQVPAQIAEPLAWTVRESTTNVIRHASASRVLLEIGAHGMTVVDDGVGVVGSPGNGICGMRERLAEVGAQLTVLPAPNGGTKVEVAW